MSDFLALIIYYFIGIPLSCWAVQFSLNISEYRIELIRSKQKQVCLVIGLVLLYNGYQDNINFSTVEDSEYKAV